VPPKTLNVSDFRKQVLHLLDHLPPEGVIIARRGQPLAKLIPATTTRYGDWIGSMKGMFEIKGDIMSTGIEWEAQKGLIDGKPVPAYMRPKKKAKAARS
jgi:antitoxin (DNA-binding transcriptional repressor) of toxin-antitoxin stability system